MTSQAKKDAFTDVTVNILDFKSINLMEILDIPKLTTLQKWTSTK